MIQVLSKDTIDKIAAGEVVERPASCIKELCENSIDAGAGRINVEIKGGGVDLIRVSDDGCGIRGDELETAFLRHATSKIRDIKDLETLTSLGFRGEALSSIAAVSRLEVITKTEDSLVASRYRTQGGEDPVLDEIGAPNGTTFIIKDLFFNTPVRRKFLKSAATEASYCAQMIEHLALSHPEVSFSFINNGRTTLQTWGRRDLKDVIYQIYGRDVTRQLLKIDDGFIGGYIARPTVARSARNMELFFVNGRYIRVSRVLSKALEDAYAPYLMQHKFPFAVLSLSLDGAAVDANIHPQKLEVRFSDNERIYELVFTAVSKVLKEQELIPRVEPDGVKEGSRQTGEMKCEPLPEEETIKQTAAGDETGVRTILSAAKDENMVKQAAADDRSGAQPENTAPQLIVPEDREDLPFARLEAVSKEKYRAALPFEDKRILREEARYNEKREAEDNEEQLGLFEEKILTRKAADEYKYIGQVFDTYWIIQHKDRMLLIDQHAAHEKVLYERFVRQIKESGVYSQQLMPPLVMTLSSRQEQALRDNLKEFEAVGFELEDYGGRDICIRAVPENLSSLSSAELFAQMLDELVENGFLKGDNALIRDRIATMACKAAVKGNNRLTEREATELVAELLTLDNPYNCPHGRPTMIVMTKYELEKNFKRII